MSSDLVKEPRPGILSSVLKLISPARRESLAGRGHILATAPFQTCLLPSLARYSRSRANGDLPHSQLCPYSQLQADTALGRELEGFRRRGKEGSMAGNLCFKMK